ncbi:coiled-coil domain-containing protein 172 [Bombina bombina]|uniref:coiled-coil domain-containing protein 172 n=1 Tax=Bombina bombina TaxID=8345 RepID=UPI00235A838C|nr:coiled-coil domain-containing protein 172 [Bombina bombina]
MASYLQEVQVVSVTSAPSVLCRSSAAVAFGKNPGALVPALSQQVQCSHRETVIKSESNSCHERLREVTSKLTEAKADVESKSCLLCEKMFELELLKKHQDSLGSQREWLLNEQQNLLSVLQNISKEMTDEEEQFMKEVIDFNTSYGLTSNREMLIKEQVRMEMEQLENEEGALRKEMKSLKHKNYQLNTLQLQKNSLKNELEELQLSLKDLDDKIADAMATTNILEAEKVRINQKPQSDVECLRLKKELETYKEDDLENVYETLRVEIEFLQVSDN